MRPSEAGEADLRLLEGDCLDLLAQLPSESVDAVVTDPPYGIGINGERWDLQAIHEAVAKPGRPRMNRQKAFEVWCGMWGAECLRVLKPGGYLLAFGSPRTAHRLGVGLEDAGFQIRDTLCWLYGTGMINSLQLGSGRGTTLKPSYEPILLTRRPLEGTTEATVERYGTGVLQIGVCRVEGGRHPANVVVGHGPDCRGGACMPGCAVALLNAEASTVSKMPSRFFYCPKVSRREREAGCGHLPLRSFDLFPNAPKKPSPTPPSRNPHPTVKPLALMRWLVRLVCPRSGLLLDPFCGSGSTGAAAALEGRRFLGIEFSSEFSEIASARIDYWVRSTSGEAA